MPSEPEPTSCLKALHNWNYLTDLNFPVTVCGVALLCFSPAVNGSIARINGALDTMGHAR